MSVAPRDAKACAQSVGWVRAVASPLTMLYPEWQPVDRISALRNRRSAAGNAEISLLRMRVA